MRIPPSLFVLAAATVCASACSSEPATVPGVAGAGLQTKIVGLTRDSTGYAIALQITNRDTALVYLSPECPEQVETIETSGAWTTLDRLNGCVGYAPGISSGAKLTFTIVKQALTPGTEVRVTFNWENISTGSYNHLTTSEPVAVN
jgi:hypothetical protein